MARAKGEYKHKLLAVLLYDEFNRNQQEIGDFLKITQSTVSSWIREGRWLKEREENQNEISRLTNELMQLGYNSKELNEDIIDIL